MSEEVSNNIKITNPQRIYRIFQKICQSKLQVFLRAMDDGSIAVKGFAFNLDTIQREDGRADVGFHISEVSEKGIKYLMDKDVIRVEFVMTSTKVVCVCKIIRLRMGHVILALPTALLSVERRSSTRSKIVADLPAFLNLSLWQPKASDFIAPPAFPQHRHLATLLPLTDISLGGLCVLCHFPSLSKVVKKDSSDPEAILYLPMQQPLRLGVGIRWVKSVKEHEFNAKREDLCRFSYYLGCQFIQTTEESSHGIKAYMQQLVEAEAI